MSRPWLALLTILWLGSDVFGQSTSTFRSAALDSLVLSFRGIGTDSNLVRIDRLLRSAGPDAPPQLKYFLRRYRSEQLYYQGLFTESMVEAEKARRIAEQLQDSLLLASSLNQVAVLLEVQADNAEAIAMLRDALHWYPRNVQCAYPITQPYRIHGNLGRCYANIGELDSARTSEERSFQLAATEKAPRGMALALLELGHLQLRTNNFDSALVFYNAAIDTADAHAIRDVQLEGLAARAEAYVRSDRTLEALKTFELARRTLKADPGIAKRSVVTYHVREIHLLADAGLYREALSSARSWRTLDSALRSSSARTAQRTLAAIHKTDAELLMEHAAAEQASDEIRAEKRNRATIQAGGLAAVLLLVAFIVIYIGRGRQKDALERLALQRSEQDRQIADLRIRQQVGADLHDDLGAGLSALKLNCELAEDLSPDGSSRTRNQTLARIASDLIAGMRHILWSLHNTEATAEDIATYLADRARELCAGHDRPLRISMPPVWPKVVPDAELRHLQWIIVKEAIKVMLGSKREGPLELTLSWNKGLVLTMTLEGEALPAERTALAAALSPHQLRVSRMSGSLRSMTDGPLRAEFFLPFNNPEEAKRGSGSPMTLSSALLLLILLMSSRAATQDHVLFRNATLDSLFTPEALLAPPSTRLRSINAAIDHLERNSDARLECNLLLARANKMYYQGLYDVGIADVNRSLALAQQLKDSLLIATTYNMFGLLNENLGNDAVTLPWFQLAGRWLPQDTRSNYPVVKDYHIDGNIAQCLLNLGHLDSAEHHFVRSVTAAQAAMNLRAQALANLGLARIRRRQNDLKASEVLLDSARAQALRAGSRDVYVDAFPVLAEVRMRRAGQSEGARILDEALAFIRSDSTVTPVSRRNFFKQASVLREELGQYEEAMKAWRQWQQEDSAIHLQDDRASLATLKIMLDNDQRLLTERTARERSQAQLASDREQRRITIIAAGTSTLLLLGVLLLYAGRRRNQRRLAALKLERSQGRKELAELRVRHRLSEEMHEEIGSGLDALKLRSELALEVEQDPAGRERLAHITLQAAELIGSLRQIIWALDTGRSSLQETVHYTAHYARNYAAQQGLPIHLGVDGPWPDIQLTMEQRRNCFLVVKEALHNIVKHARATRVEVRFTSGEALSVEIADNGRGMNTIRGKEPGNGMRNMRKRIEAIGGQFHIEQSNGTTIRFTVPLVVADDNIRSTAHAHG